MKEKVIQEYQDGCGVVELSRKYRCRASTISAVLREADIDPEQIGRIRSAEKRTHKPIRKLLQGGIETKPSDVEWAYLAGFFDGEGTIHAEHNNNLLCNYRVSIAQKEKAALEWVKDKLGKGFITTSKKPDGNHCSAYKLCAQRQVYDFLIGVLPYLIVKKEKSLAAISALKTKYLWE